MKQVKHSLKPYSLLSKLGQRNRSKKEATVFYQAAQEQIKTDFHNNDIVTLNEMNFTINRHSYSFTYNEINSNTEELHLLAVQIKLKQLYFDILLMLLNDSTELIDNEEIHFNDQNIVETVIELVEKPNYHYTLILYPGAEKYKSLEIALALLILDLEEIKNRFVDRQEWLWNIYLYFLADWKMLALCLGHKAANANYFCLWYNCKKDKNSNFEKDWRISKNNDIVNQNYININGHIKKPIFSIISLHNWIIDELHLLLPVWDQLWSLVITELKATKLFDSNY
ncbi:27603_t:CDS:2, partial [Gigaspora margarita]